MRHPKGLTQRRLVLAGSGRLSPVEHCQITTYRSERSSDRPNGVIPGGCPDLTDRGGALILLRRYVRMVSAHNFRCFRVFRQKSSVGTLDVWYFTVFSQ